MSIFKQLQGLLLKSDAEGFYVRDGENYVIDSCYVMDRINFTAQNDAAHVCITKTAASGEQTRISLYDLVVDYITQFGGEQVKRAVESLGNNEFLDADAIFIDMCLFTEAKFGVFFTGKFTCKGFSFSVFEIASLIMSWVQRPWSFKYFATLTEQRLFFASLLVRMEIAVNVPRMSVPDVMAKVKEFFSNPRGPCEPFEQHFVDWCSIATKRVESALEFASFCCQRSLERAHVPDKAAILAFAMARKVPDYLAKSGAWILDYFQNINFRYAGRLNVVYKPERTYVTMAEIADKWAGAVEEAKKRAEAAIKAWTVDWKKKTSRERRSKQGQQAYKVFHQKDKELKILSGRYGLKDKEQKVAEEEQKDTKVEEYKGRKGEDAKLLREKELKNTAVRNLYIYSRLLDSFPLMNRVSDIKEMVDGKCKVTIQLFSYHQYEREVEKVRVMCQEGLMKTVQEKMSMRRRLRAVYMTREASQSFADLPEDKKAEMLRKAEEEMRFSGEWDRLCDMIAEDYLQEQFAAIREEDARVNYTIDVEEGVIEHLEDFCNTARQMVAVIPGTAGMYINERVRRGVIRIHRGKQMTYNTWQTEEKVKAKMINKQANKQ